MPTFCASDGLRLHTAYAHDAMASDVLALLDRLQLDTAALAGYSLGAGGRGRAVVE
jgi:pimeloyl-ACP methyl ester carboxylesterase